MSSTSPGWQAGTFPTHRACGSRRGLEIVAIVFTFLWFWPLAVAYLVWKFMGYPVPTELREWVERGWSTVFGEGRSDGRSWSGVRSTGNAAFDEYRRSEIERLEAERRRLDEEAREFRTFVDELKRAKDREEFDAYMARRRRNGPATA